MKRIIELSENDYMALKEDGVHNHIALANTIIDHSVPYESQKEIVPVCKVTFDKEQLQEIVDKAKAEVLASIQRPHGEWIPVSEELPNRNGVYNVTRKLKEGETIYFISDASYFDGQNTWHRDVAVNHGRPYLTDVIAWQPRPEPYKEGGAE